MHDEFRTETEPESEAPRRRSTWIDPNAVRFVAFAASFVLAACGIARWLAGEWGSRLVPLASAMCLASRQRILSSTSLSKPRGSGGDCGKFYPVRFGHDRRSDEKHMESFSIADLRVARVPQAGEPAEGGPD